MKTSAKYFVPAVGP